MFVRVTLPVLLTLPEKVIIWPCETACGGHTFVTLIPGVVISEQVMLADATTLLECAVTSVPCTRIIAVLGLHGIAGIQLPLKLIDWLIAMLTGPVTYTNAPLTRLETVMPPSGVLPQLTTEPL